jgi:hypothetical protein
MSKSKCQFACSSAGQCIRNLANHQPLDGAISCGGGEIISGDFAGPIVAHPAITIIKRIAKTDINR